MNVVVLAGGFGSRLKPLTNEIVKPMLTISNVPMIDYTVSHLTNFGIKDFVFTLAHFPEQIINYVSGYRGISSHFSVETEPLGTLGGVKAAERFLGDTFIVISGDALEDINFNAMLHKHRVSGAMLTMAVKPHKNTELYGVVEVDSFGSVIGFQEKPKRSEARSNLVNCGVYIVQKELLKRVPKFTSIDFAKDFFPLLLEKNELSVYVHDGYWRDIGDYKSYYSSNFEMLDGGFFKKAYNYNSAAYASYHIGKDKSSLIAATANLVGAVEHSIVGQNSIIASSASVKDCIILNDTLVTGRHYGEIVGKDFNVSVANEFDFLNIGSNISQIYNYFS